MARKKKEEELGETQSTAPQADSAEETVSAAPAEDSGAEGESVVDESVEAAGSETEKKPKKASTKKAADTTPDEEPSIVDDVVDTAAAVIETVAEVVGKGAADLVSAIAGPTASTGARQHKRAEKIGKNGVSLVTDVDSFHLFEIVDKLIEYELALPSKYDVRLKRFCVYDQNNFDKLTEHQKQKLLTHHTKSFVVNSNL